MGEYSEKERKEIVDGIVSEVFYFKEVKGRGELSIREDKEDVLLESINKVYRSVIKGKGNILGSREECMSNFTVGLYKSLMKYKGLRKAEDYRSGSVNIGLFEGYLIKSIRGYMTENSENGDKVLTIEGKKRVVKLLSGSIDYTYSDGNTVGDSISEGSTFNSSEGYGLVGNRLYNLLIHNKEEYLTANQSKIYDALKDNFTSKTDEIRMWGYKNREDYLKSRGVTEASYKRFIINVRERMNKLEEEYTGEEVNVLLGELNKFEEILDNEELSDKECQLLLNKQISKNYEKEEYEVLITKGLSVEEKVRVVRMVKELKGIKIKDKIGTKTLERLSSKTLSKSILYKIINNVLDGIEDLESGKTEDYEVREAVEEVTGKKKAILDDKDKVVYIDSYGMYTASKDIEW